MELKELIKKRIEENVPDYDITKVERYEYLFEMIAIEFASEQVKLLRQPAVISSVFKCTCSNGLEYSNCAKNCKRREADNAN